MDIYDIIRVGVLVMHITFLVIEFTGIRDKRLIWLFLSNRSWKTEKRSWRTVLESSTFKTFVANGFG